MDRQKAKEQEEGIFIWHSDENFIWVSEKSFIWESEENFLDNNT